jgi:hypothetical protein
MNLTRRSFTLAGLSTIAAGNEAFACADPRALEICNMGTEFAGIRRPKKVAAQEKLVWCWAATLQMIFAAHRRELSQESIVEQVYGGVVDRPIDRLSLFQSIDRTYEDENGDEFDVTSGIYDLGTGQATIGNDEIIEEFKAKRPIIYCNKTHMVAAYGARYSTRGTPFSPNVTVCKVYVADPWPPHRGSYRTLEICEMVPAFFPGGELTFVATVDVS